jgi:hypothetical protein
MLYVLLLDELALIIEILPENQMELPENTPFEKVKLSPCTI